MKELEIAQNAAKQAATYIIGLSNKIINSSEGKDIKLQADIESEKIIVKALCEYCDYPILTEESGELNHFTQEGLYWIVDPIDGTLNFSRDIPIACISIALYHKHEPLLGVIYDFNRDEMFSTIVGQGIWLNNQPIHVSNIIDKSSAIIATGFPSLRSYDKASLDAFVSLVKDFKKVRLLGSAALSLAYVACGRIDAYMEEGIRLWDVAAGLALVQSAGGFIQTENTSKAYTLNVFCSSHEKLVYKK